MLTPFNVNGQLPLATGVLYTATTPTVINSFRLVNTDGGAGHTANLYVKTVTARHLIPVDLALASKAGYLDVGTTCLNAGDAIEGDASAANVVDYVISGAFRV